MSSHSLARGRYLELLCEDGWEYARRVNARTTVGVVALTPADELLLVEQQRRPVAARVIELPAGLVGDEGDADEDLCAAAARELLEETGWRPARCRPLMVGPSSAGLTDECCHLILACDLVQEGTGGGVGSERITVHAIARSDLPQWLDAQRATGHLIDFKIYAALWWLASNP